MVLVYSELPDRRRSVDHPVYRDVIVHLTSYVSRKFYNLT